jgi:hypothetical protein
MIRALLISAAATAACIFVPVVLDWGIDKINLKFRTRLTEDNEFQAWVACLFLIISVAVFSAGGSK